LLLTGLGFYSPWLQWLLVALGGGQVSRILHPWIGLVFVGAVIYMYAMWRPQMHVTDQDKAWFNSIGHYVRNEDDQMPAAGRYNAGQKLLFWGFFVFGLLLLLSGLVLWFPEYIPWSLRSLRYIAVIVHVGSALITIGFFMLHVYMGVFAERGAFGSVIRGDVTAEFARRYHPQWYEEVTGARASTERR